MSTISLPSRPHSRRPRDPSDPAFKAVELAQRGRMILDVTSADLEVAEERLGPFHETTWHSQRWPSGAAWRDSPPPPADRRPLEALEEPPLTLLSLGESDNRDPQAVLLVISGATYAVQRVAGTALAPVLWRLFRIPPSEEGPYYLARLHDGSTQCDCAEWTYQVADVVGAPPCKHLAGLRAAGGGFEGSSGRGGCRAEVARFSIFPIRPRECEAPRRAAWGSAWREPRTPGTFSIKRKPL